jgi:hypothetical protein
VAGATKAPAGKEAVPETGRLGRRLALCAPPPTRLCSPRKEYRAGSVEVAVEGEAAVNLRTDRLLTQHECRSARSDPGPAVTGPAGLALVGKEVVEAQGAPSWRLPRARTCRLAWWPVNAADPKEHPVPSAYWPRAKTTSLLFPQAQTDGVREGSGQPLVRHFMMKVQTACLEGAAGGQAVRRRAGSSDRRTPR